MVNPNKAKGDRAERAVLRFLQSAGFPRTWKTRAGWDDDRGDVLVPYPTGEKGPVVVQVKDVATPLWSKWHEQVADQVRNAGAVFGVILHKRRGFSDPADWHVIMTGRQFAQLLDRLGYTDYAHMDTDEGDTVPAYLLEGVQP